MGVKMNEGRVKHACTKARKKRGASNRGRRHPPSVRVHGRTRSSPKKGDVRKAVESCSRLTDCRKFDPTGKRAGAKECKRG